MVPVVHGSGKGLAGLLAYVTHDADNPETADRVAWTQAVNLPVDDAVRCGRIMAATVRDAEALKAAAGISTRGRKLKKPYEHMSLSLSPDESTPTQGRLMDLVHSALEVRGYAGCHAFVACHRDRDHDHVHIVTCRIDPETGRTRKPTHILKLSRWAENFEEETHGRLLIPNRRERRLVREYNAREIKAAVKENREPNIRKLPPMQRPAVRDALGRPTAPRSHEEAAPFREMYEAHKQDGTPTALAREERVALARTQAEARVQDQKGRVSRELEDLETPPAQAPARVSPEPPATPPSRKLFVVDRLDEPPAPPVPVRAAPAPSPAVTIVDRLDEPPAPPVPVRAAPAPSPVVTIVDRLDEPPAPPMRIDLPRPTSWHDGPSPVRGKGRPVGGGPPAPPPRSKPRRRP